MSHRRISLVLFVAAALVAALCGTACAAADEAASPHFGVLSLLPPVVAIVLCLTTHEVIPSLFVGSWIAGTWSTAGIRFTVLARPSRTSGTRSVIRGAPASS